MQKYRNTRNELGIEMSTVEYPISVCFMDLDHFKAAQVKCFAIGSDLLPGRKH